MWNCPLTASDRVRLTGVFVPLPLPHQAVERLEQILLGVWVDDQLIKELPSYHGEAGPGHSLLKAVIGEGVVDSFFPLHDSKAALAVW